MATMFPIRIRASRETIEEFFESEYGRWEDAGCPETPEESKAAAERTGNDGALASVVLLRAKTRIVIENEKEAEDVFFAVSSGTFQIHHFRAARRIADALEPVVREFFPETVERWGGPDGR